MDFEPSVRLILEQPFSIHYQFEGENRRYTPDVLAETVLPHGKILTTVYEVKPLEDLRNEWDRFKPRFQAAIRHCGSQEWRFKIVTEREIRTPFVNNAKFLRRYRSIQTQPIVADQILYTLKALGETTPQALIAAAYLSEEKQMGAIPELWRLIAMREIAAILDEPLTMHSPIWHPGV